MKGSIIPKEKSLIALALRLKRRKCVETLQKQTLDVIFNTLNSHLLVLTDRRNLSSKRPKSSCGNSPSCRISFSAARKAITKATENITFGFSSRILVFFPYGFFIHQSH